MTARDSSTRVSRITAEYVRSRLDYSPETGEFHWRHRVDVPAAWNGKWGGKVAGTRLPSGYIQIGLHRTRCFAHRLAWLFTYGEWPDRQIDHINGMRDDNRIVNLRLVTQSQSSMNSSLRSDSTSGRKGVSWSKSMSKWLAHIGVEGRFIRLGYEADFGKACNLRAQAEKAYHGEYRRGVGP